MSERVGGGRLVWADTGRGVAILLVVFVHVRDWLSAAGFGLYRWDLFNQIAAGARMPLFFTISGLLASKWLTATWPDLVARKLVFLGWVYLVWQPVGLLAAWLADTFTGGHMTALHFGEALGSSLVRPRSELWFLWALMAYLVLARAGRRLPLAPQVAVAGAVSLVWLSGLVPDGSIGWNGVPKYFLFFLLGIRRPDLVTGTVDRLRARPAAAGAAIAVWAAVAVPAVLTGTEGILGVGLLDRCLGLVAGLAAATLLSRVSLLRRLGARTLPIYVAHTPLIAVAAYALHRLRDVPGASGAWWLTSEGARTLLPLVVEAGVVAACLAVHAALRRTPGRILYQPPRDLTRAAQTWAERSRPPGPSDAATQLG